ncbi:unnamed protein product [Rhodiola kirilowii]
MSHKGTFWPKKYKAQSLKPKSTPLHPILSHSILSISPNLETLIHLSSSNLHFRSISSNPSEISSFRIKFGRAPRFTQLHPASTKQEQEADDLPEKWLKKSMIADSSVGVNFLRLHSLPSDGYWYWLGVGVLLAYGFLFNVILTWALAYLNPIRKAQAIVPLDATQQSATGREVQKSDLYSVVSVKDGASKRGMILPFEPMTMTFHNVNYFVDMPKEKKIWKMSRFQWLKVSIADRM